MNDKMHKSSAAREFEGLFEMRDLASTKNAHKLKKTGGLDDAIELDQSTPLLQNQDDSPTQKVNFISHKTLKLYLNFNVEKMLIFYSLE